MSHEVINSEATGGYDANFYHRLIEVEDRHFWFVARNALIARVLKNVSEGLGPGYGALEVGCGTGNVLRTIEKACAGGLVIGMDLWLEGLRYAQQRTRASLVQGDMAHSPFNRQFDVIGMFDVLEHIQDDRSALRQAVNLLSPTGRLVLTVPANPSLWSYFDEAAMHCRRYSKQDLIGKLHDEGAVVEFVTPFMSFILPLVWITRRLGTGRRRPPAGDESRRLALNEFRIVPFVNGVLSAILRAEALWVGKGGRLPFGTSLLVVARKS